MAKLSAAEQEEFNQLKFTLCKYGFLTSPEEMRFDELLDKDVKAKKIAKQIAYN